MIREAEPQDWVAIQGLYQALVPQAPVQVLAERIGLTVLPKRGL